MDQNMCSAEPQELERVSLLLRSDIVAWIDMIKEELGLETRSMVVEQLLSELMPTEKKHEAH